MFGIILTEAPADWQILQQQEGFASVTLKGNYKVHPAALEVGVEYAIPQFRVMGEQDNMTVIPWTYMDITGEGKDFTGTFETTFRIPVGGLYRIETSLETKSTLPNITWLYRGDCVLHLGVGDLFVIAGQSNSAGYSRDFCADPPSLMVHLYRNRSCWDLACHPLNESTGIEGMANEEMGIPGVSPYLSFGKKYQELTGRPVGLVQTSLGGSPMRRWTPEKGELYLNMLEKMRQAGNRFAGVLWYQGCSDTDPGQSGLYAERFRQYVTAVRRELGYEIPFFTMQLNRQINGQHDECWGAVREAQRRAALEIPGVYILSTTNLSLSDGIHNSAPSNVVLGEKLAMQCNAVLNQQEEYEAPALREASLTAPEEKEELKLEGVWLKLTYDHVKNALLIFSGLGADSGFTLRDQEGPVAVRSIRSNREDKNHIYLELEREPEGRILLSFAWQADPVKIPPVDETTYLPPVSCYEVEIL